MKSAYLLPLALALSTLHGQGTPALPEVHPDHSVTFRLADPKASNVTLTVDWQTDPLPMTLGADGVWTVTTAPVAPNTYIYSYNVDGVAIADPVNPRIKFRARGSASLVDIPPASPALWDICDVPHGSVDINWHKSTVLNGETRMYVVYTPPGYGQHPENRYPVLYLLHGANDTAYGWTMVGNVNFLLDNLLAAHNATPMIIVMPYGYALPYGVGGGGQRGGGAVGAPTRNNTTVFEEYLFKDLMPEVAAQYRIAPGRENCAVAGMSMGAEQSLYLFFRHLDAFSAIGALCPSSFRALETDYAALLNDAQGTNGKIALFWLGCGRQDPSHFPGSQRIDEVLTAHQINHIWHPTEGVHNYALWRQYMAEFVPLVFRTEAAAGESQSGASHASR